MRSDTSESDVIHTIFHRLIGKGTAGHPVEIGEFEYQNISLQLVQLDVLDKVVNGFYFLNLIHGSFFGHVHVTYTHTLSRKHHVMYTHTLSRKHTHTHKHTETHTLTDTHAQTQTHTHARAHAQTQTLTHKHTQRHLWGGFS